MRILNPIQLLQALLVSGFAVFTFGFNHLGFTKSMVASMDGSMSGTNHARTSAACQSLCNTAIKSGPESQLVNIKNDDKDLEPFFTQFAAFALVLLGAVFVVKKLHLLTSWRPPDKILLCGHYADGL